MDGGGGGFKRHFNGDLSLQVVLFDSWRGFGAFERDDQES